MSSNDGDDAAAISAKLEVAMCGVGGSCHVAQEAVQQAHKPEAGNFHEVHVCPVPQPLILPDHLGGPRRGGEERQATAGACARAGVRLSARRGTGHAC